MTGASILSVRSVSRPSQSAAFWRRRAGGGGTGWSHTVASHSDFTRSSPAAGMTRVTNTLGLDMERILGRMGRVSERRLRDEAYRIWKTGVIAVDAGRLVTEALEHSDSGLVVRSFDGRTTATVPLRSGARLAVVGAGKATAAMVGALPSGIASKLCRELIDGGRLGGWVNVPDAPAGGHEQVRKLVHGQLIRVHGARSRPDNLPTEEGVAGSREILRIARSLSEDDVLLVLLSGGGSALLPLPVEGVSLADKLRTTALLQECGATIGEMNCVRKHLSQIKGGRLAQATKARVVTLIVSDVTGDPLDVIASGPTAPDPSTFADACDVLSMYGLEEPAPASVVAHLRAGRAGQVGETPKTLSDRVTNVVIGNTDTARRAAVKWAESLGYAAADSGVVAGDTQLAARDAAAAILGASAGDARPLCFVGGGETTVSLPSGHGKGGRNQEFALAVLATLGAEGLRGACFLSGGTDGEDGPTDAAGAFVDEELARAAAK